MRPCGWNKISPPFFLEKFCLDRWRRDLSFSGFDQSGSGVEGRPTSEAPFQIRSVVTISDDKNRHMSVASAARRPILWLKLAGASISFHCLRICERLLPPSVLGLLLWPLAAAWDLVEFGRRELITGWHCFPELWQRKPWHFFLRQSLGLYHAQFLYSWPDRLGTTRWLSRCRLLGPLDASTGAVAL